ncbi:hypothetical protein M9458_052502, partial [Cirrhinus mrigala]
RVHTSQLMRSKRPIHLTGFYGTYSGLSQLYMDKCKSVPLGASVTSKRENFLLKIPLKECYAVARIFLKMPFRPCSSGCGGFLSPSDGHDRCMLCLGRAHVEAAFVDGSCPHYAPHPSPLPAGTEAAVVGAEGDLGTPMEDNPPSTSSRTSHSPPHSFPLVEFPGEFDSPPQDGLDFSFRASEGNEVSVTVSEARAYTASGQATSALHAMAILQVYQAKALKELDEGSSDPELLRELREPHSFRGKDVPEPRSRDGWILHGNIITSLDTTSSSSPGLCHRSTAKAGPRNKTLFHLAAGLLPRVPRPLGAACAKSGVVVVTSHSVTMAEHLFSRCGVRIGHHDVIRHAVNAELLELLQAQDSGHTETISEAPVAFCICSHSHADQTTSQETASALASRQSPEMGMVPRHTSSGYHVSLSVQPLVGPCVSMGESALRPSVQTCCGYNRCFQDWLGCCVQRACSLGFLVGPPSAMAHQLPIVADCALGPEEASAIDSRQACVGPYGQHSDCCVHQPASWSTLLSQVATSPPSPPLESAACEIAAHRSHPGPPELCSRCALIDLFAFHESTHCALCYSLTDAPPCISPSEPQCTDSVQSQGGMSSSPHGCPLLAQPDLVHGPHAACVSSPLANSPEEGPSFSGAWHNLAPVPRSREPPRLVPGQDKVEFRDLSPAVIDTITQTRAPCTRQLNALKWHVFTRPCPFTWNVQRIEQLYSCFGGQRKGKAVSKQRMAHWIVDAILRAYQAQDSSFHSWHCWYFSSSTRASLADICRAASWATPNTFARVYNLHMEPVS